jgi:hypothetical protein
MHILTCLFRLSIRLLKKGYEEHALASVKNDIQKAREAVTTRMEEFRNLQAIHSSSVKDYVLSQPSRLIEDEDLFLPSSFSGSTRNSLGLSKLAQDEAILREALSYESILQLRLALKAITILHKKRKANVVGQHMNTRARSRIHSMEAIRDHNLAVYNTNRKALITLGTLLPDDKHLPPLTQDDLHRKSTVDKRQTGDTNRTDGKVWAVRLKASFAKGMNGKLPSTSSISESPIAIYSLMSFWQIRLSFPPSSSRIQPVTTNQSKPIHNPSPVPVMQVLCPRIK